VRFDAADQVEAIAGELRLRRRQHRIDGAVTLAGAMGIDVAAVLGPGRGDESRSTLESA
jgi:hypothetical protein